MARIRLVNPYRLRGRNAESHGGSRGRESFSGSGVTTIMSRRRSRGRRGGRRRNPFGIDASVTKLAGWAIAGGIAARSAPEMLLPSQNSGFTGYALNLGATVLAAMAAGKFFGPEAAKGVTIGGIALTAGRVVEEQFGRKLVEFSSIGTLSGDPGYALGDYGPASFPLPNRGGALVAAAPGGAANAQFNGF